MDRFQFMTCVGGLTITYLLVKLLSIVYSFLTVFIFPTYPDFSKYGKWSVITGSTDGIGKAIAFELAAKGQNIILIARKKEKLENVAKEINNKHKVLIKHLAIDFTGDENIYNCIKDFLDGHDIGVLVNNVGCGPPPLPFLDIVERQPTILRDITRLNMFSVFKMSHIVLQDMIRRGRGIIINMSSGSAVRPTFSVYGSTKCFVNYFSQALHNEYANKGIIVQSCMPGVISTKMTQNYNADQNPLGFVVKPEYFAKSLLATIEKEKCTHGCWQHALQLWFLRRAPQRFLSASMRDFKLEFEKKNKKSR